MNAEELAERVAEKWWVKCSRESWKYDDLATLIAAELRTAGWDRFEAMEEALRELLMIQGEIHPPTVEAWLERLRSLKILDLAPLPPECNPDGSPSRAPPI